MKYQMREKMFAIGDDYWIETDGGQPAFKESGSVTSDQVSRSPP